MKRGTEKETRELLVAWCQNHRNQMTSVERGSPQWDRWRAWREANGLGVAFMDSQPAWTVPSADPPIDRADLMDMARPVTGSRKHRSYQE